MLCFHYCKFYTVLQQVHKYAMRWESTGFQAQVDWIPVLTGPEKNWKPSVILQTSLYFQSLALIKDLSDQFEKREANGREKQAGASKNVQVELEVCLPSSCSTASSELATFFLAWWWLWRPNYFQRRLSITIAQRAMTFLRWESVTEEIASN